MLLRPFRDTLPRTLARHTVCARDPTHVRQGVPPAILRRWLRTEAARSARDWQPLRPQPASEAPSGDRDTDAAEQPPHDPQRVVLLEDIRDCIFPIADPELRYSLVLGLLTLLGVPLAAAAAAVTSTGGGGGVCTTGVGCVPYTFLQLLPTQTALAVCQQLVPGPGGHVAAGYGGGNGSGSGDGGGCNGDGASGGAWLCEDESRRLFVARVLKALLLRGPYSDQPQVSSTLTSAGAYHSVAAPCVAALVCSASAAVAT